MLAVSSRTGSTQPHLIDVPPPAAPGPGQVLCRTLELGICGTDREILHSANPWTPPGDGYLILGHECLARIEEVGDGVSEYRTGDLVVPAVRRARPGQTRRLDYLPLGTFTERGIWSEHGFSQRLWLDRPEHLYGVPADIEDLAVFAEPLAVAEKGANEAHTLQKARLGDEIWMKPPPRVLVTGMGPIGFASLIAAIARGWPVAMYGRDEPESFRAGLARAFGATYVPAEQMTWEPDENEADGFDLVLECTGSDEIMLAAAQSLRSCGIMVWLGSTRLPGPRSHNVEKLMRDGLIRNQLHIGSVNAAPRDFCDALTHLSQLKATHGRQLASLITARVKLEDSLWHYEHRQPQGIKTVIDYA
ncbi:MAG TPA: alcohol dehydrogenase catalytic domain-containing protein [Pirellulaceae bacterium]|nr:alcohol dehydrogenase catalytic domain-containing protein [Pirellulaceae bacterium]